MMSTVTLDGASGFLARAERRRGAVLLLPMIYGVNKFVREYAASLATAGLSTLVWDPYPDEEPPGSLQAALARSETLRDGPSLDAMSICVDYLLGEFKLDTVGIIGFCLGGRYALPLAARESRIGACVSIYPTIHSPRQANEDEDVVSRAGEIGCPVQLVYPGRDHLTGKETFQRLQENLQRRPAPTVIHLLPAAGHGFMHTPGPENETAARMTRPLVAAFLAACLAP
jgi:carboxymethylenebutenolidase